MVKRIPRGIWEKVAWGIAERIWEKKILKWIFVGILKGIAG